MNIAEKKEIQSLFNSTMEAVNDKDVKECAETCFNSYRAYNYLYTVTNDSEAVNNSLKVIKNDIFEYLEILIYDAIEYVNGLDNAIAHGFFNESYSGSLFDKDMLISESNKINIKRYYAKKFTTRLELKSFKNYTDLISSIIIEISTDIIDYKDSTDYKSNDKNKDGE